MSAALSDRLLSFDDPSIFLCVRQFLLGAAMLMRAYPDLSIEPIRDYGESLLALVHKCVVPSKSFGVANDQPLGVLQDYYTAHL